MVMGLILASAHIAGAVMFCVSTAGQLKEALSSAADNDQPDLIMMVQGTYSDRFELSTAQEFDVVIQGGYNPRCLGRVENPANTIFDPSNAGTGLTLASSKSANFTLNSLTFRNGRATPLSNGGGGLSVATGGDLTVVNCVVMRNSAPDASQDGGGVYVSSARNITFTNVPLRENSAKDDGGGMYLSSAGDITLTNVPIKDNNAENDGGGMYVNSAGNITFTNAPVSGNSAKVDGGGLYLGNARDIGFDNSPVSENSAEDDGGGVYINSARSVIFEKDSSISDNSANDDGGGAYVSNVQNVTFSDNISISGNTAVDDGGGVYVTDDGGGAYGETQQVAFTDITISENTAQSDGGGLYLTNVHNAALKNLSITGNSAKNHGGGSYASNVGEMTMDHLNISRNTAQNDGGGAYANNVSMMALTSLTVSANSAENDGGGVYASNGDTMTLTDLDIIQNTAKNDGGGAYVSSVHTVTFDKTAITENSAADDGGGAYISDVAETVTFTNNIITNNAALNTSHACGGGVYVHNTNKALLNNNTIQNNRSKHGAGVYADIGVELAASNNLFAQNVIDADGFGGGIYISYLTRASLTDNTIQGHSILYAASGLASGIGAYIFRVNDLTVARNIVSNNVHFGSNEVHGGGLYISADRGSITDNFVSRNIAMLGGGIYFSGTGIYTLNRNDFSANSAHFGGGVYAYNSGSLTLTNNVFELNAATFGGGGFVSDYADACTLTNNTITRNRADEHGGGIRILLEKETDTATLYNNIIWNNIGNDTASLGKDLYIQNDGDEDGIQSPVKLFYNNFDTTSSAGNYFEIPILIDSSNLNNANPLFVNATDSDYHLGNGSLCLNVGKNDAPAIPETDKEGYGRIIAPRVDLGAYEAWQPVEYGELSFVQADYSVSEDSGSVTITVQRTEHSSGAASVQYAASDGTAQAGSDYTAVAGTLTFATGVVARSFTVPILADSVTEGVETVMLTLSQPAGARLGVPAKAVLTIIEDDRIDTGDMDHNGKFEIFDLQRLINCIFEAGSCTNGDLNNDRQYNVFDMQQLINKIFEK